MKKLLAMTLCVVLCLGLFPVTASAASPVADLLGSIAYYGDPSNCKMTAQQAETFAEVIREQMRGYQIHCAALMDFGNGIPALYLVGGDSREYEGQGKNGVWTQVSEEYDAVWIYANGEAEELFDHRFAIGDVVIGPKGIVETSNGNGGGSIGLSLVANGSILEGASHYGEGFKVYGEYGATGEWTYSWDGQTVTAEEYYALSGLYESRDDTWAGYEYGGTVWGVSDAYQVLTALYDYASVLQIQSATSGGELLTAIPYYGDRSKCRMSAAQARAYADVIASLPAADYADWPFWCYWSDWHDWRATLVDVDGDGVPILMLSDAYIFYPMDGKRSEFCGDFQIWEYRNGRAGQYDFRADAPANKGFDFSVVRTDEGPAFGAVYFRFDKDAPYTGGQYYRVSNGALSLLHTIVIDGSDETADQLLDGQVSADPVAQIGLEDVYSITHPQGAYTAVDIDNASASVVASALRKYADLASTAYASTQEVELDGKKVEFQCYALKDAAGNPTNYIKLRDLAALLNGTSAQFEVGWDGSAVTITTGAAYTPNGSEGATPFSGDRAYQDSAAATKVDGKTADLSAIVLTDDNGGGYTYYKLRDLGQALGFNVGWSAERGVFLETGKPYDANN